MLAVDAARWWGPLGWSYRNLIGNLAASGVCFAAAGIKVRAAWLKHKAHEAWMAQHVANLHLAVTGEHADPHPAHGSLTTDKEPA